jgi:phosphoesterase RecJ-like protein
VLVTHVNADGDGAGSEAAVAGWIEARGVRATIVNPTPFPEQFRFVLHRPDVVAECGSREAAAALAEADLLLVLDTSEPRRIGSLAAHAERERTLVIDHHPAGHETLGSGGVIDPSAAATGELVYDLLHMSGEAWPANAAAAIYVALVTDTGSFRYSNTSPRAHAIAAELIARGVDPEAMYRRLYATVPPRRLALLKEALATLESDERGKVAWIVVADEAIRRLGATDEDLDGLVEYPRNLAGTEVALFFRETADGHTKISFRSNGDTDVNRLARSFGGGGHVKAAGAKTAGTAREVVPAVVAAVQAAVYSPPPSSK